MTDVSNDRRGTLSPHWYWLQVLVIAGSALAAALLWKDIPPTVTTHYNFRFEPDGFGAKSWGTVFLLNIVQLCLLLTLLGTNAVIARTTSVHASDKGENEAKRRKFRFVNSVFLYGLSLLLTAFFSYIQATMLYGWPSRVLAAVTVLVILLVIGGIIGLTVTVRRLGLQEPSGGDGEGKAEGAHWLAGGGLYYNPQDPAVFVPKKYGIGWTVNFGRPMGWVVVGTLILIPFAIVTLVALMT